MDKEKLLGLVKEKIGELDNNILERREYLRKKSNQNLPQIDPYKFVKSDYWIEIHRGLNACINDDELLREYNMKIKSLVNYRIFIEGCCDEDNISAYGLP
jgi:hypothetical protein